MKKLMETLTADRDHWVGDGFPVRSLFSYHPNAAAVSPFLLFDYAGPYNFAPNIGEPRGVGRHPHRGFETVTIVYDGEVSHKDSEGGGGTIGAGDVQWMTAAGGILHEEYHSKVFSRTGGPFRMVQLWVNLPAKDKMSRPKYQAILSAEIPVVTFAGGKARIIAGAFGKTRGPASTFTPINIWDVRLDAGANVALDIPEGHNALLSVLSGRVRIDGTEIGAAEVARLSADGAGAVVETLEETVLLVLTGEPIDEPVVGQGPFVMNTEGEIRQAFDDFKRGKFGLAASA